MSSASPPVGVVKAPTSIGVSPRSRLRGSVLPRSISKTSAQDPSLRCGASMPSQASRSLPATRVLRSEARRQGWCSVSRRRRGQHPHPHPSDGADGRSASRAQRSWFSRRRAPKSRFATSRAGDASAALMKPPRAASSPGPRGGQANGSNSSRTSREGFTSKSTRRSPRTARRMFSRSASVQDSPTYRAGGVSFTSSRVSGGSTSPRRPRATRRSRRTSTGWSLSSAASHAAAASHRIGSVTSSSSAASSTRGSSSLRGGYFSCHEGRAVSSSMRRDLTLRMRARASATRPPKRAARTASRASRRRANAAKARTRKSDPAPLGSGIHSRMRAACFSASGLARRRTRSWRWASRERRRKAERTKESRSAASRGGWEARLTRRRRTPVRIVGWCEMASSLAREEGVRETSRVRMRCGAAREARARFVMRRLRIAATAASELLSLSVFLLSWSSSSSSWRPAPPSQWATTMARISGGREVSLKGLRCGRERRAMRSRSRAWRASMSGMEAVKAAGSLPSDGGFPPAGLIWRRISSASTAAPWRLARSAVSVSVAARARKDEMRRVVSSSAQRRPWGGEGEPSAGPEPSCCCVWSNMVTVTMPG
ncbi:hypothetical protein CTA1_532 [Colletotrichum tanaceti]|uniref:Uncharacterized protein n=1 Tax=Colletotrichum tanaceti TaxID=1306861 RepID=A0A4U6X1Q9_9PEZI|nr:hypothetical protein CTA1_532 [Colletotrichum tanaceti]